MKRLLPLLSTAGLLGCTPQAPAQAPIAPRATMGPQAAPSPVALGARPAKPQAPLTCKVVRLAAEGISACMPGVVSDYGKRTEDVDTRGVYSVLRQGDEDITFWLASTRRIKTTEPLVFTGDPDDATKIESKRDYPRDGFPARTIQMVIDETRVHQVMVAIGNRVLSAFVQAPDGAVVDPKTISGFLESFQIELPYRLFMSPEDRFTISVPGPAIDGSPDVEAGKDHEVVGYNFSFGGEAQKTFHVLVFRPLPGSGWKPDTSIDRVKLSATALHGTLLRANEITIGGAHGSELFHRSEDGFFIRYRFFSHEGKLYMVGIGGKTEESLTDAVSKRVIESFQFTTP